MTFRPAPRALVIAACLAAACVDADPGADDDAMPAIEDTAPAEDTAAGPPAPGMTEAEADDCGLHREHAHPDPAQLVRDYATRDSAGAFLRHDPWIETAVVCPAAVPGYDVATVIAGFDVGEPVRTGDSARVPVTYHELGELILDEFDPARAEVTETFELVRTRYGWRIVGPQVQWHLARGHVLDELPLAEKSRSDLLDANR